MLSEKFAALISRLPLGALGMGSCVLMMVPSAALSQAQAPADSEQSGAGVADGMTVHIDPKTGKVTPPPPGAAPPESQSEKNATSTSGEGLTEQPNPAGGGYKLDLKGRFQNR